jgi:hypothetical protein
MALDYVPATPATVKETIEALLDVPDLNPSLRAAIERLATSFPEMNDLWRDMIPAEPAGMEGSIISRTLFAYERALALRPPIPRTRAALSEYLKHHRLVEPTYLSIATGARALNTDLGNIPSVTRSRWAQLSSYGAAFDQVVTLIEDVAAICDRLDAEARETETALNLPKPPRRRGAIKAQRTYFGRIMSDYLERLYGRPCDPIVNTLENIVFDLRGEIEEGTARSRRRGR